MSHDHNTRTKSSTLQSLENKLDEYFMALKEDSTCIKDELLILKDVVIKNLQNENKKLKEEIKSLKENVVMMEKKHIQLDQYGRRNNLEINGIPSSIKNEELDGKVIDILGALDIKVQDTDIEACHRIGNQSPKTTIVRFVNRRFCYKSLAARKHLKSVDKLKLGFKKDTRIFINENLSPDSSRLAYKCRLLKRKKLLSDTWSTSGIIYIRRTPDENPKKILHDSDIEFLYPNFDFKTAETKPTLNTC